MFDDAHTARLAQRQPVAIGLLGVRIRGVRDISAIVFESSPGLPPFMKAITNLERSSVLENTDPVGQDAALLAAGRTTAHRFHGASSFSVASGQVIANSGRSVERVMPSGLKTRESMASA